MAAQQTKQFELGEQPEWAGKEPNTSVPTSFVETLLAENNTDSLINRGYCVVKLDEQTVEYYSTFHKFIEEFFALTEQEKAKYALLQFDPMRNSPNQCHGYSQVSNLKEQFMLRCIGNNTHFADNDKDCYIFPHFEFGKYGMQIYQSLDLRARELAQNVMVKLGKSGECVTDLLDPINEIASDCNNIIQSGKHTFSSFMPSGYISSSIMDNFHYFPPSPEKHQKFHNNHACHTDSGLMTAVITTDEPGLELLDQTTNQWIQIEEVLQTYLKENGEYDKDALAHRRFATFFWCDSVVYLNNAPFIDGGNKQQILEPLFHRVADCENERFSVVFKQRTAPLRTHCRYQEDYILASIQQKVDTQSKNAYTLWGNNKKAKKEGRLNILWISAAFFAVSAICLYTYIN